MSATVSERIALALDGVKYFSSPLVARGTTYIISVPGIKQYKIGATKHESAAPRIKQMRASVPGGAGHQLVAEFPGGLGLEKALHRIFQEYEVSPGGEWFHAEGDLEAFVREIVK